ncbi:12362_t:CDS:2 [Racocetra fulgida]|uniref:12362_t:CDS:1 n=1 Tax=Racocetra fulgida TaxID=60492 RepID=A0A9N8WJP6_9GLOM|nr:12362_t:CDS:2 [Racocetra fulgida]
MLSLIPDPPVRELLEFCQSQNIRNIHLQVGKKKDNDVSLIYSKAIQSVQIIIDPSNLPIFIHCLDGANVTGLVVACLRKLQMWSIPSCMGEFLSEFIEKFSGEIEIPSMIPHWLWGGHVTSNKHPTLKLKFLDPRVIEQFEQKKKNGKSIEVDNKDKRVNGEYDSMTLQALALEGLDDIND